MLVCLFSLQNVHAIVYNDGPEPENPYYMHILYLQGPDRTEHDVWAYIKEDSEFKYMEEVVDYFSGDTVNNYNLWGADRVNSYITTYDNGGNPIDRTVLIPRVYTRISYVDRQYSTAQIRQALNLKEPIVCQTNIAGVIRHNSTFQILENTIPIRDLGGQTIVFPDAVDPEFPYDDRLFISQPRNGFVQSGSYNQWAITVGYQFHLEENEFMVMSDWIIEPHSDTIKGLNVISNDFWNTKIGQNKYIQGYMKANYSVPLAENQQIYFTMTNKKTGEKLTSEVFTYHNLVDFVDEDGDGLDDRSGLNEEIGGNLPDWNMGQGTTIGDITIPDISNVVENIKSFLYLLIEPIALMFRGVPELYALIIFGFAVAVIKFALGR